MGQVEGDEALEQTRHGEGTSDGENVREGMYVLQLSYISGFKVFVAAHDNITAQ